MNSLGGANTGGSIPDDGTQILDLSAAPERILRSVQTGSLAGACSQQQRMALHVATAEGQAWVDALRAVSTPSAAEATRQVASALRGLALTAPDPVPPELSVCASRHPTTSQFNAELALAIGNDGSVSVDSLMNQPRYPKGTPGHIINIHTHSILNNDGTKYVALPSAGLSDPDILWHILTSRELGREIQLTTASVSILSGHTTSLTGTDLDIDIWAPTVLEHTTIVGTYRRFSGDILQAMRDEGRRLGIPVVAPPDSILAEYKASVDGWYAAGRTPAAVSLSYLNSRELVNPP